MNFLFAYVTSGEDQGVLHHIYNLNCIFNLIELFEVQQIIENIQTYSN